MNETANYDFTIVVPVYNEQDNLERVEKQLSQFLPTAAMKACVLLVNDGSTDDSLSLIKQICQRQPDFLHIIEPEPWTQHCYESRYRHCTKQVYGIYRCRSANQSRGL